MKVDAIDLRILAALLRDLWEQARTSHQTVELYETTILPQARHRRRVACPRSAKRRGHWRPIHDSDCTSSA